MSFVKDSLGLFLTQIFLLLTGISRGVVLARILGPIGRGKLRVVTLLPSLLVLVGNLGIGNANIYFIGKRKFSFQYILSNSLALSIMLGGFLMSLCLVSSLFLKDTFYKDIAPVLILISILSIPFTLLLRYTSMIFIGKQMIREKNLVDILHGSFWFICIVVFVFLLRLGIVGALISMLGGLLLAVFYCLHRLRYMGRLSLRLNYELFKNSIGYGVRVHLAWVMISLNESFDIFLVKSFLNNAAVGYYSVAALVASTMSYLPVAIGKVTYARVASLNYEQANQLTPKVCRNTILASFVVGILLFCTGRILIPLVYGQAYMPSVNAFMILIPGLLAMSAKSVLHSDLAGRGRPGITLYVFSGGLFLNIVLNLFLIPRIGIEGAALASTLSYTASSIGLGYIFSRLTNIKLRDLLLIQRNDIQDYRSRAAEFRRKMSSRFKSRVLGRS